MAIFSSFHRQSSLEPQWNHRQSSLEPQESNEESTPISSQKRDINNTDNDPRLFHYAAMGKAEVKRRADASLGGIGGALQYCLKVYPEHKKTAPIHNNLAVLYELKQDQRSADRCYQTALDIMEKRDITFARIYLNYAEFLIGEGRTSLAEEVLRIGKQKNKGGFLKNEFDRVQALLDSHSGYRTERKSLQRAIVGSLSEAAKSKEAEAAYKEFERKRKTLASSTGAFTSACNFFQFAFSYVDYFCGAKKFAEEVFENVDQALDFCQAVYPKFGDRAEFNNNLALLYELKKDDRNALVYYQKAMQCLKEGNYHVSENSRKNILRNYEVFRRETEHDK